MQNFLQELVVGNIFAFLLIFMRFGVALMIMPGIGDSFVTPMIRLLFALGLSFVLTPALQEHLPSIPSNTGTLLALLCSEAFIGLFIGSVMRILVSALDTAGTLVSVQTGLSTATLFNPTTDSQGTVMSAVYSSLGVTLMFVADLHHRMLAAVVDSYNLYPADGHFPNLNALSETVSKIVTVSFKIGVEMAIPFIVVGMLTQIGLGLLGRLMPQVQVFFIAMPIQIFLGLVMLTLVISASIAYWLDGYESIFMQSLAQ